MSKKIKKEKLRTLKNIWGDTEKKNDKEISNTNIKRNNLSKTTTGKR